MRERFKLSFRRSNSISFAEIRSAAGGRTLVSADSICDSTDLLSQPLAIPPLYASAQHIGSALVVLCLCNPLALVAASSSIAVGIRGVQSAGGFNGLSEILTHGRY